MSLKSLANTVKRVFAMAMVCVVSSTSFAYEFSFDRPGTGFGTGITPVGKVAWEQGLPTVSYSYNNDVDGKNSTLTLNADTMLRTGLMNGLELQLSTDGYSWQRTKIAGEKQSPDEKGWGDVTVGLKKAIDLKDDKLKWALLAQATQSTGNDEFTNVNNNYLLGSSLEYAYDDIVTTAITMFYSKEEGNGFTVTAVPTLGYQFTDKLSGFSEFVYTKTEGEKNTKSLGTGVVYSFNDRAQVDASIGLDLNSDERSYNAGLGFAFLF